MLSEEEIASSDLDTAGYHFKWKKAQEIATKNETTGDDSHLLPYWERVRLRFLELGGEYLGGSGRGR